MWNDIQYPRGIERTYARIAPRIISKIILIDVNLRSRIE
jgi:hypothetical protein